MSQQINQSYEFGPFRLDRSERVLLRGGEVVPLAPKAFDLLLVLVESTGRVLPKEELMKQVWPDSFVEEANLSHHVFTLRKALGENNGYKFIETIPRRGYRFVAQVAEVRDEDTDIVVSAHLRSRIVIEEETDTEHPLQPAITGETTSLRPISEQAQIATTSATPPVAALLKRRRTHVLSLVASLVLIGGAAAFGWYQLSRSSKSAGTKRMMKVTRVTNSGKVGNAAISPDGKFIAYGENYTSGKGTLYVRQTGTNNEIQLLEPDQRFFGGNAFSPDGGFIYYVSYDKNDPRGALYRIPVLGGPATRLVGNFDSMFTLSPDGRQVTFYRQDPERKQESIIIADLESSSERVLITRDRSDTVLSGIPAWSPNGQLVAFGAVKTSDAEESNGGTSLFSVAVSTGEVKQLSPERFVEIGKMTWTPDGQDVVFVALRPRVGNQMYCLSYPGCEVRRITNDLLNYGNYGLGITSDSNEMVADIWEQAAHLWVVSADSGTGDARELTLGTDDGVRGITLLLDGRIAYIARTGDEYDIWTAKEDGTETTPLTADSFSQGDMSATPDGRYLVFISDRAGGSHLFRMDIDGSNLTQLTFGNAYDSTPDCSPNGKWVVYASTSEGKTTLWKVPVEGGTPSQLTDYESVAPSFSPDGRMISCVLPAEGKMKPASIAVLPAEGRPPLRTFPVLTFAFWYSSPRWTPDGQALVFPKTENHVANLWRQPIEGGPPKRLTNFKSDVIFNYSYTRDGKSLILSRGHSIVNVVLVKNFR